MEGDDGGSGTVALLWNVNVQRHLTAHCRESAVLMISTRARAARGGPAGRAARRAAMVLGALLVNRSYRCNYLYVFVCMLV
eukprot:COSAG02_NODE_1726_length_11183_cov_93.592746_1_plen_81_part_00